MRREKKFYSHFFFAIHAIHVLLKFLRSFSVFRLRSDLYRCNLYWEDDRTLLIGWANSVKVCQVVPLDGAKAVVVSSKDQLGPPRFYVKISK